MLGPLALTDLPGAVAGEEEGKGGHMLALENSTGLLLLVQ